MELEIITPDKKLFEGTVRSMTVPGSKGSFQVLNNHAPIISTLEKGTIKLLTQDYKDEEFQINSGVVEVKKNKIIVLAEVVAE